MTNQSPTNTSKSLSLKQAADYIGCAESTLRLWKRQERGPAYYRAGKLIRYRVEDLDEWILDQMATPTPPTTQTIPNPNKGGTANSEGVGNETAPETSTTASLPQATYPPYSSADLRLTLLRRRRAQEQ